MALNRYEIIGNLGNDPEIKDLGGGSRMASMSIATNEGFVDKKGNKKEDTQWHIVIAWGKLVDVVEDRLKKGDKVFVTGKHVSRLSENGKNYSELHAKKIDILL